MDYMKRLRGELVMQAWLLHVAEPDPDFVSYDADPTLMRDQTAKKYHREHSQLQQLSRELNSAGIKCTALLVQGAIVETILNEANKLSVDTIVLGSHRRRFVMTVLAGSTVTGILHQSTIPVLVIPDSRGR